MFKAAATYNDHINIDEYAISVSAYINKCTEDVKAGKSITTLANQKPLEKKEDFFFSVLTAVYTSPVWMLYDCYHCCMAWLR